jgi:GNAT superfamily N-acetyltransferase
VSILVRPGEPPDIEAAVDIFARCGMAQRPDRPTPKARVAEVKATLAAPQTWMFVAVDGSIVIGFAAAMPSREELGAGPLVPGLCYLDLVFVAPERWGEGVGAMLLDTVIAEARGRGFSRIHLLTHDTNDRAHRLYASRGFTKGTWSRMSRDPANGMVSDWARPL